MKTLIFATAFVTCTILFSCGAHKADKKDDNITITQSTTGTSKQEQEVSSILTEHDESASSSEQEQTLKESRNAPTSSSAARQNTKDTTHHFIRTADLKFKVNKVIEATYAIENIVAKHDGFVTHTHLFSRINEFLETPLSHDSVLETTKFTVLNNMILRVPNYKLDTVLKSIAPLVVFLDYRTIKADDVSLSLLSNRLAQIRNSSSSARLEEAVKNQGKKPVAINDIEHSIIERQEQADAARLSNIELSDKIKYSTINLELYQHPEIKTTREINDKSSAAFEPPLYLKIVHSLQYGWHVFEAFLLFILKLWPLAIVGVIAFFVVKKYGK